MTSQHLKTCALAAISSVPALALSAMFAITSSTAAHAQEKTVAARVTDTKTAERIEMVSGIRALGQRIGAALCLAEAGVDKDANMKIASDSLAELANLVDVVENGSEELGRGKEEDRRVQGAINGMKLNWQRFDQNVSMLINGENVEENYDFLSRHNLNMSYASRDFLVRLMQVYVQPPEILQSYALTLDIAARQRALTQQMAKEACGLATDNAVMGSVLRLKNASRLFDLSMTALRDGFPAAGVITPPSDEISSKVSAVYDDWQAVKADVNAVNAMGAIDAAKAGELFQKMDGIYQQLEAIAELYIAASKFQG